MATFKQMVAVLLLTTAVFASEGEEKPKPKGLNPFTTDANRTINVHEVDEEQAKKYIKSKKTPYNVIFIVNLEKDRHEGECPHQCTWMDKQFEALAEGYTQQARGGQIYSPNGAPTYFARYYAAHLGEPLVKLLGVQRFPSVMIIPAGGSKPTKYGSSVLNLPKVDTKGIKEEKAAREKNAATMKYLKRANSRMEKRKRQISTQEEREEATHGTRNYHMPNMNNFCKWIKIELGQHMAWCPQDVDHNIASKESKSEGGKKIIVGVVVISFVLYIIRAFGVIVRPIDSSKEDLLRDQTVAAGVRQLQDKHVAYKVKGAVWSVVTSLASVLACVVVGCCASGMYHNFLNNRELLGDNFRPPLSRVTGFTKELPNFSIAVATMVCIASACLISMGRLATSNYTFFKLPLLICVTSIWVACGLFMLTLFVERNGNYLHGTPMHPFIEQVKKL